LVVLKAQQLRVDVPAVSQAVDPSLERLSVAPNDLQSGSVAPFRMPQVRLAVETVPTALALVLAMTVQRIVSRWHEPQWSLVESTEHVPWLLGIRPQSGLQHAVHEGGAGPDDDDDPIPEKDHHLRGGGHRIQSRCDDDEGAGAGNSPHSSCRHS